MPWINKVNSLIQTSYCGMHGGLALARVLFGEVNPSGHLAETYPVHLCDTPTEKFKSYPGTVDNSGQRHVEYTEKLMVGYRYYETEEIPVLFPFGYGLSYTTFDLHDFPLRKPTMKLFAAAAGLQTLETEQVHRPYSSMSASRKKDSRKNN